MKVDVYYNLHKRTFSIRSRESESYGRIVGHSDNVVIISPEFVVRQAGREKVLKTKQKNVHAFVRGHVLEDYAPKKEYIIPSGKKDIAKYNPYKYTHFVNSKEERVYNADMAVMTNNNNIPHIEVYNPRTIYKHKGV